jgi:hypothetical protein
MDKPTALDHRSILDTIRMSGTIAHRDGDGVTLRSDNLLFEIPAGDVVETRELAAGQHELLVRKNAKIVLQSMIDAAQTAYVLNGRGAVKFINQADNCTDCSACTNCGTDCSKCTDCTECSRVPVELGAGIAAVGPRFLTPLATRQAVVTERVIDSGS